MSSSVQREEEIFAAVVQLPPERRDGYLDEACGDDSVLRQRIEVLLRALERASPLLREPAATSFARTCPTVPPTEKPGDRIGRYKLLEQIGEGGCGVVYVAEQEEPVRRRVALKVIKLGMDTKQVIARFDAERQALAMMDHANIAKIHDAGVTETGRPYFVMELVRGIKITDYCDQNHLASRERLDLFIQVCRAIQHAHQKGIIHRDIKPSNILVASNDGSPIPKVIDFGIAKATQGRLTDQTVYTAFEQFIGTPAYMSPEQAAMTMLDIDTRTDIYSLGVLLYELLTGKTPFDAKELMAAGLDEMRRTIREVEPVKPSTRLTQERARSGASAKSAIRNPQSAIDQDLDWIVMKCLEKDRTRRYETANGLTTDIARHLSNEPIVARPPSRLYRFQKSVQRNKLAFAATGAVLSALLIGLTVSTVMFFRAEAQKKKAQNEAAKSQQVAHFLKEMLAGVGPSVAQGQDTKLLRGILDKTAERVGKELAAQPAVEAELLNCLGEVYLGLGDFRDAVAAHKRALQLRQGHFGAENEQVAESLSNLGNAFREQGNYVEAEAANRAALAMCRKLFGNNHTNVAAALNDLGLVLDAQGSSAAAENLYHEAVRIHRTLLGEMHPQLGTSLCNLGIALRHQGKLSEAETIQREVLTMRKRLLPKDHPDTSLAYNNLANVLQDEGKLPEAEAMYRQALAIERKLVGEYHPRTATRLNNLGTVLGEMGKLEEAEELFRRALIVRRKLLPPEHPEIVACLTDLGILLRVEHKLLEAENVLRDALQLRRGKDGGSDLGVAKSLQLLTEVLRDQDKLVEAEGLARDCLTNAMPDSPATFITQSVLGGILSKQRKYAEAETWLLSGCEGLKQRGDKLTKTGRVCFKESVSRLVQFYEATSQPDKAAEWKQKLAEFDRAAK